MADLKVSGKIKVIYETKAFGEKAFRVREFVLELEEEVNGNVYTNFAKMQVVQAKCDMLDKYSVGDNVNVNFNIKARSWVDRDTNETKYMTNLECWKIEQGTQTYQAYTPQTGTAQQQATPPASNYNAAPLFNPSPETIDDLPF